MKKPPVRYAKTKDGFHVAYQVIGDKPIDVVFMPNVLAPLDAIWEHPGHLRWNRYHASFCRMTALEARGFSVSDPVAPERLGDLDDWVEDAHAVMDAVGIDQAVMIGEMNRAAAAISFFVAYPERVRALILWNGEAGHDRPVTDAEVDRHAQLYEDVWGSGQFVMGTTLGTDPAFEEWAGRFERIAASPGTAAAYIRASWNKHDVRPLLHSVNCPTLVVYSGDIPFTTLEQSRELAEGIPGARLLDLSGSKSFAMMEHEPGNEYETFITGAPPAGVNQRELATLLFTDIVGSTSELARIGDRRWQDVLADLDELVGSVVTRRGGRVVNHTGDGHLATFTSPSSAIEAAREIRAGARVLGLETRIGLHTGEVEVRADGNVSGLSVHVAARVMSLASAGELLVSRTVADLAAGAGVDVNDRGTHELKGVPGTWQLFEVKS